MAAEQLATEVQQLTLNEETPVSDVISALECQPGPSGIRYAPAPIPHESATTHQIEVAPDNDEFLEPDDENTEPRKQTPPTFMYFSTKYDDFEELKEVLLARPGPEIVPKVNRDDRRRSHQTLDRYRSLNPKFLAESAKAQYTNDEDFLKNIPPPPDKPQKDPVERHVRRDQFPVFGPYTEQENNPALFRVIDVKNREGLILCEIVIAHRELVEQCLHFVAITRDSLEAPALEKCGWNCQYISVNDLVWIYDVKPFDDSNLPKRLTFSRRMYRGENRIYWQSTIHCFLQTTEFQTAYGCAVNNNGNAIITHSDEYVNLYNSHFPQYFGRMLEEGEMFKIDYLHLKSFNYLASIASQHSQNPFAAGFSHNLKPGRRSIQIYVVAVNLFTKNEKFKMKDPFRNCSNRVDAVGFQTIQLSLAKFTDAVLQQRDAEAVTMSATIEWNFDRTGRITLRRFSDSQKFIGSRFMTICVPNVLTFLAQLETRGRLKTQSFLQFSVFDQDKHSVKDRFTVLCNHKDVYVSPVEQNPTDDYFLGYLTSGLMARTICAHLLDIEPMNNDIFDGMRMKKYYRTYDIPEPTTNKQMLYNGFPVYLDKDQCRAAEFVGTEPLPSVVVIEACAGSGKTLCSVNLMMETVQKDRDSMQLMCATTNRAVDNMAEALFQYSPRARTIRLFSKTALDKMDEEPEFSVYALMQTIVESPGLYGTDEHDRIIVRDYLDLRSMTGKVARGGGNYYGYQDLKQRAEDAAFDVIRKRYRPNIILTTVDLALREQLTISRFSLMQCHFDRILIDEGSQLDEARLLALLSLNMTTRQVVVVGDRRQLPPYTSFGLPDCLKATCDRSAIDLLVAIKDLPVLELHVGYRMHKGLLQLTSRVFYDNKVKPADKGPWQRLATPWKRFSNRHPIILGYCGGEEEDDDKSKMNQIQAKVTMALVREAIRDGVSQDDIGIICLYNGQVRLLDKMMAKFEVQIASVDSYQGREKRYIIVNTVRSTVCNFENSFFSDMRRANVATSRAVLGMIILGEKLSMQNSLPWGQVWEFAEMNHLIQEKFCADLIKPKPEEPPRRPFGFW